MKSIEKNLTQLTYNHYYKRLKLLAKSVYKWNNLPEGIDERTIERYLYSEGKCMFFKDHTLGLIVTKCTCSGINANEDPTTLVPVTTSTDIKVKDYENEENAVLIRNNDDMLPTADAIRLYAYRLADITRTIDINISAQKTPVLIITTDKQKLTMKNIYRQWNGFEPVIYGDKEIDLSGVKVLKTDAPIVFDKLQIEKDNIWNEAMTFIGVNNANMNKRERLVDDEVQANDEQIELFADVGLKARQKACELINNMFGTNISVEFRMTQRRENEGAEPIEKEGEE